MNFTIVENSLWAAGFVGHLALIAVLVRFDRWRKFPVFTALVMYQACVSVILFGVSVLGSAHDYFCSYWILAAGDYSFQIALLVEIAHNVLPESTQRLLGWQRGPLICSIVGALFAAGVCITIAPTGVTGLDLWDERTTLFTSILTCELYLAISIMANRLRLQWQDHVMVIGQGLALWAGAAVVGDVGHAIIGWKSTSTFFDQLRMLIYIGALAYWTVELRKPERGRTYSSLDVDRSLTAIFDNYTKTSDHHKKGCAL